jgi:hypothetical protein
MMIRAPVRMMCGHPNGPRTHQKHGMWRRLWLAASLLGLVLTGWPVPATAQVPVASEERFFGIEWQMEHADAPAPAIVGSVSNPYQYPVQRLQLRVQVVDEVGQVTHESFETIGDLWPGGRRTFRLELPATGARLVVTVHSFEFGAAQSP